MGSNGPPYPIQDGADAAHIVGCQDGGAVRYQITVFFLRMDAEPFGHPVHVAAEQDGTGTGPFPDGGQVPCIAPKGISGPVFFHSKTQIPELLCQDIGNGSFFARSRIDHDQFLEFFNDIHFLLLASRLLQDFGHDGGHDDGKDGVTIPSKNIPIVKKRHTCVIRDRIASKKNPVKGISQGIILQEAYRFGIVNLRK